MGLCSRFTVVLMISVIVCVNAQITSNPANGACLCATTRVRGRSQGSLSGNILVVLSTGKCGKFIGGVQENDGYTWYQMVYEGQTVWVAGKYLRASVASCCDFSDYGCPVIISRAQWGARSPKSVSYLTNNQPLEYAFIHHSGTDGCTTQSSCASSVRSFQNYHMDTKKWDDIGYSFLIGGDGSIFEGRGWDRSGAHTKGYNSVGLGFCLIGNFENSFPQAAQIQATQTLIKYGVFLHKLSSNYKLRGHRDMVTSTVCPGRNLYNKIQSWPHYSN